MREDALPRCNGSGGSDENSGTETYHERYEWESEGSLATAVVSAIAAVMDTDPASVDPLYEVVDLEALEAILRSIRRSEYSSEGTVYFRYRDHPVYVSADGRISVQTDDGEPLRTG